MAALHPLRFSLTIALAAAYSASARPLPPDEAVQGFERLFAGTEFPGQEWFCWDAVPEAHPPACTEGPAWKFFPAEAAFGKDAPAPSILSVRAWKDFEARFDFISSRHSVFFYRIGDTRSDHPGMNLGYALRDHASTFGGSGADWDAYPSRPDSIRFPPVQGWSSARVVAKGDSVEHWLNGEKVVAFRIGSPDFRARVLASSRFYQPNFNNTLPVDSAHPLMKAGPIGWLGTWDGPLKVRNFRIADLPLRPATGVRIPDLSGAGMAGKRRRGWVDHSGLPHDAAGRRLSVPAPFLQNP